MRIKSCCFKRNDAGYWMLDAGYIKKPLLFNPATRDRHPELRDNQWKFKLKLGINYNTQSIIDR